MNVEASSFVDESFVLLKVRSSPAQMNLSLAQINKSQYYKAHAFVQN